ncbi:MAG: DSD1 family PLP-dependent enzyme, partial [Woeseiaceae bacterium]
VSCGGTGTYWISARQSGVSEIQAGGGVFCDVFYREQCGVDHEYALTVLATVISRPTPTRIVCDSGWKSMSQHLALPRPLGIDHVVSVTLSAEHATINLGSPSVSPKVHDKVEFVVGYCDATLFLHDQLHVTKQGRVVGRWSIPHRGFRDEMREPTGSAT